MTTESPHLQTPDFLRGVYRGPVLSLSGETALLRNGLPGYVWAQFDFAPKPYEHLMYHWHEHREADFTIES